MSIKNPGKPANKTFAARIQRATQMVYLFGASEKEVAETLGIKVRTLHKWQRRAEWDRAIAAMRDARNKLAFDRLSLMPDKAVTALDHLLECENPAVRLQAATWILQRQTLGISHDARTEFELFVRSATGHGD